jgi:hypothetical protein
MEMGYDALIFMTVTWLAVVSLNVYCFAKILKK